MPTTRGLRSSSRRNTPISPPKGPAKGTFRLDQPHLSSTTTNNITYPELPKQSQRRHAGNEIDLDTISEKARSESGSQNYETSNEEVLEQHVAEDDDTDQTSESSRPQSAISTKESEISEVGTTESQTRFESLDKQAIVEGLEDLYQDSRALLSLFPNKATDVVAQFYEEAQRPGSTIFRRLEKSRKRFELSHESYGGSLFINTSTVVRRLATAKHEAQEKDQLSLLESVLQLANVARYITSIFAGTEKQVSDSLQFTFNTFPISFVSTSANPAKPLLTSHSNDTVALGVDLRTQLFVSTVKKKIDSHAFDPSSILQETFWNSDGELRGIDTAPSRIRALIESMVLERVKMIREFFTQDPKNPLRLEDLEQEYPWKIFLRQLADWSQLRGQEIIEQVDKQGGIQNIVEMLQQYLSEPEPAVQFDEVAAPTTSEPEPPASIQGREILKEISGSSATTGNLAIPSKPAKGKEIRGEIARLRELQELNKAKSVRDSAARGQSVMTSKPNDMSTTDFVKVKGRNHRQRLVDDGSGQLGQDRNESEIPESSQSRISPTPHTQIVIETLKWQQTERDKENAGSPRTKRSFIDRQDDAERIQFSDNDDQTPRAEGTKRKRTSFFVGVNESEDGSQQDRSQNHGDDNDEEESEEDFETDQRTPKERRIGLNSGRTTNSTRRQRNPDPFAVDTDDDEAQTALDQQLGTKSPYRNSTPKATPRQPLAIIERPKASQSSPVRSTSSTTTVPPPSMSQPTRVNVMAKEATRLSKELYRQPPQSRKPYSEDEVNRLLELIAIYGTKWSTIIDEDFKHDEGPKLQERSQVQLKDKARNIKLDYLKARQRLPEGFINVSIGNRQIQILKQMGIDYTENRET